MGEASGCDCTANIIRTARKMDSMFRKRNAGNATENAVSHDRAKRKKRSHRHYLTSNVCPHPVGVDYCLEGQNGVNYCSNMVSLVVSI